MINEQLVQRIVSEIDKLALEYQSNPGMILTEDDLKCHLFSKIKEIVPFNVPTINQHVTGNPLHSEVKFFDEKGKLTLIPDLTIIDPRHLSIYHSLEFAIDNNTFNGYKKYSSKSFEIGGNAIIIELKFNRQQNGILSKDIVYYQKDIDKIKRLQALVRNRSNGRNKLFGIFSIFNKTDNGKELLDNFLDQNNQHRNIEVLYKTGNVDFTGINTTSFGFFTEPRNIC